MLARSPSMTQIACSRTFLRASTAGSRCLPGSPEAAYRPVDDGIHLEKVLCFKYRRRVARDNTVRYRWRTLQLLPGTDRTSYAGAVVDVLERLDGQLEVQHQGRDIPSQEAPPRPSVLRGLAGRTGHTPALLTCPLMSTATVWVENRCPDWRLWPRSTMSASSSPLPAPMAPEEFANL